MHQPAMRKLVLRDMPYERDEHVCVFFILFVCLFVCACVRIHNTRARPGWVLASNVHARWPASLSNVVSRQRNHSWRSNDAQTVVPGHASGNEHWPAFTMQNLVAGASVLCW